MSAREDLLDQLVLLSQHSEQRAWALVDMLVGHILANDDSEDVTIPYTVKLSEVVSSMEKYQVQRTSRMLLDNDKEMTFTLIPLDHTKDAAS